MLSATANTLPPVAATSVDVAAAVVLVGMTAALLGIWTSMARKPGRWRAAFRETTWIRIMGWTAAVAGAAALGSLAAGGDDLLGLALVVGLGLLVIEAAMWTLARTFGEK